MLSIEDCTVPYIKCLFFFFFEVCRSLYFKEVHVSSYVESLITKQFQ